MRARDTTLTPRVSAGYSEVMRDPARAGRTWKGVALVLVLTLASVTRVSGEAHFENERLTVRFADTPAEEAFSEISDAAGVEISIPEQLLGKRVSLRLDDESLDDGMRQVFRALDVVNHAVVFNEEAGRRRYVVLEKPGAAAKLIVPSGAGSARMGDEPEAAETDAAAATRSIVSRVPDENHQREVAPSTAAGRAPWSDRWREWQARRAAERAALPERAPGTGRQTSEATGAANRRAANSESPVEAANGKMKNRPGADLAGAGQGGDGFRHDGINRTGQGGAIATDPGS